MLYQNVTPWDFGIVRRNTSLCFDKNKAECPECHSYLQEKIQKMEGRSIWLLTPEREEPRDNRPASMQGIARCRNCLDGTDFRSLIDI
jgi:hypothetical protein